MSKKKKRATDKEIKKKFHSTSEDRPKPVPGSNMRTVATVKRLKMYKGGKPVRDRKGKIIKEAIFQKSVKSGEVSRIAPNRKWFGNTGVISQDILQKYIQKAEDIKQDPYKILMKPGRLPLSLLRDPKKSRIDLLSNESFQKTFGKKAIRKNPTINVSSLEEYVDKAHSLSDNFLQKSSIKMDLNLPEEKLIKNPVFTYGQSKRIWSELYKVIDSSDVVIQVIDARDPMGTRSPRVEKYLKTEKSYKHLVLVMNKCDLVPSWVAKSWLSFLSKSFPTVAFHADFKKPFGNIAVLTLLKQLSKLHQEKKTISVGFVGYPNVGKSSVINALKSKQVCKVAPVPGETRVWQYVNLTKSIYLIDCPGVVYPTQNDCDTDLILKGVIRVQKVREAADHIPKLLEIVNPDHIKRTYNIETFSPETFLEVMARAYGRLLKGGEPDINTVARMVLADFQIGKLPHFVKPPSSTVVSQNESLCEANEETVLIPLTSNEGEDIEKESQSLIEISKFIEKFQNSSMESCQFLQIPQK